MAGFVAGIDMEHFQMTAVLGGNCSWKCRYCNCAGFGSFVAGFADVEGLRGFCMGIALFFAIPAAKLAV